MPDWVWHSTMVGDFRRCRPYLKTDPVVKLLTHYIGLYDLNKIAVLANLLENSLNV